MPKRTPTAGYGRLTYPHSIRIRPTPTVVDVTLMRIGLIKKLTRFSSIEATQNAKDRAPKVSEARCWGRGTLASWSTLRKQLLKDFSRDL